MLWPPGRTGWLNIRLEQCIPCPNFCPKKKRGLPAGSRRNHRPAAIALHELFEMVADRPGQADCPAVVTNEEVVSYGALEMRPTLLPMPLYSAELDAVALLVF